MARWLVAAAVVAQVFYFSSQVIASEGDAEFSISPDSGAQVLIPLIQKARSNIYMNIYMLTNKSVVSELSAKADAGLEIVVLVEGEPTGGMNKATKTALAQLQTVFKNSKNSKLLIMSSNKHTVKRRYVFDHAKYVVVDSKYVFISSDNFTGSAFPTADTTSSTGGSRGWQTLLENQSLAKELTDIFLKDTDLQNADILPYDQTRLANPAPAAGSVETIASVQPMGRKTQFDSQAGRVEDAVLCHSPKSLECIVNFIRSAKSTLDLEHLSMPLGWGNDTNPILVEAVAAAERGVKVRVLLNDETTFGGGANPTNNNDGGNTPPAFVETASLFDLPQQPLSQKNSDTVKWLQDTASRKGITLESALFDAKAVQVGYVHNKGMIADYARAFVSSINGTQNSVENNREMAIVLNSTDASNYFAKVYDFDWSKRKQDAYIPTLQKPKNPKRKKGIFGFLSEAL